MGNKESCCSVDGLRRLQSGPAGSGGDKSTGGQLPHKATTGLAFVANNVGKHPEDFYDIEKKVVGTGAFGTVKLGKNKKTGQVVALKYIQKKGRRQTDLEILANEMDLNQAMDHPNVIRMYETFEDKQFIYIAMEPCAGGEMFDLIIDQGNFGEKDTCILMEQIFRAVFYMHTHGIVHRDLKPENFLLTKKGVPLDQNTLKVIDFGIAKRFDNSKGEGPAVLTTKAGTAYYIAPEVLAGRYNEKCDVWSCGVIIYILLSGSPPFGGDDDDQILKAVKKGVLDFDDSAFKTSSADVKTLIRQCCTLDPKKRISAKDAANSKWIKNCPHLQSGKQDADVSAGLIAKFKKFSSTSRFKKAALHIIAHHVDEESLKKLRDCFTKMDVNGDGDLTLEELKVGCTEMGIMQAAEVANLFGTIDADGSGSISYSEFLAATLDQKNYMKTECFWEAFRVFDVDGDGRITLSEFEQIMQNDGAGDFAGAVGSNKSELAAMFKEADADGNGEIDFEEFQAMMRK